MIAETVARLRRDFGLPVDPSIRGPVPLNRFFREMAKPRVTHFALPDLTRGLVAEHLQSQGVNVGDVGDPAERLSGFLFVSEMHAWAYVSCDSENPLVRQRFSAAHELGHAVLHRDRLGRYRADAVIEDSLDAKDPMEREANAFAAELLMPEAVLRARAEELRTEHGVCPPGVLAYRLAAELLVSREAIRYRLKNLGVTDAE